MDSYAKKEERRNPLELAALLEAEMASGARTVDPMAKLLNIEILAANGQEAEGVMHVTSTVLNPYGMVHGGCLVAFADTVAGHNLAAAGKLCVTVSSSVSFLRPATGRELRCYSKIQKLGRQVSVASVEATDEEGLLILSALFTFSTMKEITPHVIEKEERT